jgi:hypothetical protein
MWYTTPRGTVTNQSDSTEHATGRVRLWPWCEPRTSPYSEGSVPPPSLARSSRGLSVTLRPSSFRSTTAPPAPWNASKKSGLFGTGKMVGLSGVGLLLVGAAFRRLIRSRISIRSISSMALGWPSAKASRKLIQLIFRCKTIWCCEKDSHDHDNSINHFD